MRKYFFPTLLSLLAGLFVITGCSRQQIAPTPSLVEMLSEDGRMEAALRTTLNVYGAGMTNNWAGNRDQIDLLSVKAHIGSITTAELNTLEGVLGMTFEEYKTLIGDFGKSWDNLLSAYPEIQKMNNAERQALFSNVVKSNPELQVHIAGIAERVGACPLRDICNLVVTLAKLIGGPILCDVIVGATIPIIGNILCTIALTIASDLLTGICNALPC
jgi:hypothetical protein